MADDQPHTGPGTNGRRILELMEEIRESVGEVAFRRLNALSWSTYTFQTNFEALREHLMALQTDPETWRFLVLRNNEHLEAQLREAARRLHNFVTAAGSLWWHTTTLRAWMRDDGKDLVGIDDRIARTFVGSPLAAFIRKLRVYAQKYTLPMMGYEVRVNGGNAVRVFGPSKAELLRFDEWKSEAREFLEEQPNIVPIVEIVEQYEAMVRDFYLAFERDYREMYSAEFRDVERKRHEMALLWIDDRLPTQPGQELGGIKEEVFASVFSTSQFARLEETAPDSPERAELAIEMLARTGEVPNALKERIHWLFHS